MNIAHWSLNIAKQASLLSGPFRSAIRGSGWLAAGLYALLCLGGWRSHAQTTIYSGNGAYVQTFVGSGFYGFYDGQGVETMFDNPSAIVADASSNLYVLDNGNARIRKVTPDGTVSTLLGGGGLSLGGYGGTNTSLLGVALAGIAIDHTGSLWVTYQNGLLNITPTNVPGYSCYVRVISVPSSAPQRLGVCVDSSNNVYFSTGSGNQIFRYSPTNGAFSVFAGSGNQGSADGYWIFTSFNTPGALTADSADNIYVYDSGSHLVRMIDQNSNVVTVAGTAGLFTDSDGTAGTPGFVTSFSTVSAMCTDNSGNIILACGNSIRAIYPSLPNSVVFTVAGSHTTAGYSNGVGSVAEFNGASGVCSVGSMLYVADTYNQRIRNITNNPSAQPVLPANLSLKTYPGLQITGTIGRTYEIQTSPDLSNWVTRATVVFNSSPYLWIDQNPVAGNKFYRALLLP